MFNSIKKAFTKYKPSQPKVLIIRHGETDFNNDVKSEDRIRGHLDIPLNENGINEAKENGLKLKNDPIKTFYCSDLSRARVTAEEIKVYHPKAQIVYMTELRPWNLGIYQGMVTENILADLNYLIENSDIKAKDGESFNDFKNKFLGSLKQIIDQAVKNSCEIVVVSHYRNLKTAEAWVQKGFPDDFSVDENTMKKDTFKTGEIYTFPIEEYIKCQKK